jgi:WD40 repeat protein
MLQVAPNGNRLLVGFERPGENLLLLLDRRPPQTAQNNPAASTRGDFPFYAPNSTEAAAHCQLLTAATEKLPATIRFSPDGTIMAALLRLKRSNLQFWKQQADGKFVDLPVGQAGATALQVIDRGDGRSATLLPGHAAQPQDLAFFNPEGTRILVIDSRSVFHWSFETLNDYANLLGLIREATAELLQKLEEQLQKPAAAAAAATPSTYSHRWPSIAHGRAQLTALQDSDAQADDSPKTDADTRRVNRGTAIYSAEFSPDQRWILTGADDLAAHVLDAGDPLQTLSVSDRPDVLRFTDAVTDSSTSVGSPAALAANGTGNVNYLLEGHSSSISSLRFLPPDGSLLVTSDNLGAISVWDAIDDADGVGRERSRLLPFYSSSDITVSADGQWILIGGANRVHDVNSNSRGRLEYSGLLYRSTDLQKQLAPQPVLQLTDGHPKAPITATAISADAKLAVTADRSGRIVLWSLADGRQVTFIEAAHEGDRVSAAVFLNPGQFLTAGYDGRVVRWSLSEDNRLEPLAIYRGQQILRMEVSPDLSKAALLEVEFVESEKAREASDGTSFLVCRILSIPAESTRDDSPKTQEITRQQLDENSIEVPQTSGLTWTADGQHFLLMISDVLSIYRTEDWQRIRRLRSGVASEAAEAAQTAKGLPLAGLACVSDPDGGLRLATSSGRRAQLWKLSAIDQGNGRFLASLSTHHSRQLTASFSADQKYVLTASDALRVFATDSSTEPGQTGRTVLRLDDRGAHRYPLTDAGFSPAAGDLRFYSCDISGLIQIWNWDGTALPRPSQVSDSITAAEWPAWARQFNITSAPTKAAWNHNATLLAGILRGRARCWQTTNAGPQLITLPLPEMTDVLFNDITFSGTENTLAAAGLAWDRQTRRVHYAACVWQLTADGRALLAATLIDLDSEPEAAGSNQECGGLTAIHLDPKEAIAITGAQDGRVRTWRLPDLASGEVGEFLSSVDIEDRIGNGRSARTITHSGRITSIDLSPNRRLLTADNQGQLIVWSKDVYGQ